MAAPPTSSGVIGLSKCDGETTDLPKQGVQEKEVQVRFVIDLSGCIMFVVIIAVF